MTVLLVCSNWLRSEHVGIIALASFLPVAVPAIVEISNVIGIGLIDMADIHTSAFLSLSITVMAVVMNPTYTEMRVGEKKEKHGGY